ncbi:putative leucine-rich repeat-containing protein DDB_G0290503 [Battus philenor]|uniref:putative leucine-rich repeat-containing protein DDB_G0290503 n=1 Tax=Battus philenor TaxID=42288 RepID=UPI0035CF3B08
MGGCRCTYRNCMVKTDGKTHMFHYPVFDKIRCHQWLVNARRLEFLNLKVSQLKNRVVCQHHFKNECFMNFKKEKLTFEAIPTEDGPYCDSSKWIDNSQEFSKIYPIVLEDIENEYYSINDKKANFSLKYLDFLTNSESVESSYLKTDINSLPSGQCDNLAQLNYVLDNNLNDKINQNIDEPNLLNDKLVTTKNNINKSQMQPMLIVPPYSEKNHEKKTKGVDQPEIISNIDYTLRPQTEPTKQKTTPKVQIISERTITNPVAIRGSFEAISPSVLLNVSPMKGNHLKSTRAMLDNRTPEQLKVIKTQEMEPILLQKEPMMSTEKDETQDVEPIKRKMYIQPSCSNDSGKVSILKYKIPPERRAAIQEKRKFNMKLKDVIESCVIKIEDQEQVDQNKGDQVNGSDQQKTDALTKTNLLQNNKAYLSCLEARMTKMENLLLNKIDQNSQSIIDLKNSLKITSQKKKSASTQTNSNQEAYKRFLYTEISKYLSSESINLIYEELFINKFTQNSCLSDAHTKRRKYR